MDKKILIISLIVLFIITCCVVVVYINKQKNSKIETISYNPKELKENQLIQEISEIEKIENEEQEEKEPEEIKEIEHNKSENNDTSSGNKYYIKVNYQENVVTIYTKDDDGNYTKAIKAMVCSTGSATPHSGIYGTTNKYTWLSLIGGVYGQYSTRIVGSILFHSVPYTRNGDPSALEYWEYDKLGTTASAGCVRLTVADAKWIFDNCALGTKVEFYADSDPGPLGKPAARKISNEDENVRCWDPTDPADGNPWRDYKKEEKQGNNNPEKTENKKEDKTKIENTIKSENNVQAKNEVVNQNKTVVENTVKVENKIVVENKTTIENKTIQNNVNKENAINKK